MRRSGTLPRMVLGAALALLPGCLTLQGGLNLGSALSSGSPIPSPGSSPEAALRVKDYFFPPSATFKSVNKINETFNYTINSQSTEESALKTETTTIESYSGMTARMKEVTETVTTKKINGSTTTASSTASTLTDVTLGTDGSVTFQNVEKGEKFTITDAVFKGEPASFKQNDVIIKLSYLSREPVTVSGKSFDAVKFKVDLTYATSSVNPDGELKMELKGSGNGWWARGIGQVKFETNGTSTISGSANGVPLSGAGTWTSKEELESFSP